MSSRMLFAMLCIPNPVAIAICFSFLWVSLDIRITSVFFNFRSSRYSENFFRRLCFLLFWRRLHGRFGFRLFHLFRLRFLDGFFDWSRFFHLFMDGVLNRRLGIVLSATLPICWISCSFLLALCSKSFLMAADDVLSLLVAIALFSYMVTD